MLLYRWSSNTRGRVDKTGFRDCYGVQFICTKCGSYDSSRFLYREDTTHIFCWTPLPSRSVGPSWPMEQDRAVGFVRIGYKWWRNRSRGPSGPRCLSWPKSASGPVGQYVTRGPVGSDEMLSTCDSDQPVTDGPVGPSIILGLVGPIRMLSQCAPDQPVADGPVGQSFTPGPVGPCVIVSKCKPNDPIADSPVGSTETPDPVDQKERPIQIDMKIVTTDEPASLVGTPPSSDSGIHSLGRTMGKYEYKYDRHGSGTERKAENLYPNGQRVNDTCVPPNTEEDQVILCPWMDCLLNRESDESSSIGIHNYKKDPQGNENMGLHSDREPTSDESLWEDYEAGSDNLEIISKEGGPVVPQTAFQNSWVGR